MGAWQRIALLLTIIGAINWGLIGFFNLIWLPPFSAARTPFGRASFTALSASPA